LFVRARKREREKEFWGLYLIGVVVKERAAVREIERARVVASICCNLNPTIPKSKGSKLNITLFYSTFPNSIALLFSVFFFFLFFSYIYIYMKEFKVHYHFSF
jgi:hypothetical protein